MAGNRFGSQAAQDALLKYAPQQGTLKELMREAEEQYRQTTSGSQAAAQGSIRAARQALPAIQAIYKNAGAAQQAGTTLLSKDLSQLPGASPAIKAGAASEVSQQLANQNSAKAEALKSIREQQVQASAGAQFATSNAQQVLRKELVKLFGKSQELAGQQGSFASTEQEKLAHEAEKLEQSERQSLRSVEQREKASERTVASKAAGKLPAGYLPQKEQDKAASQVASIKELAQKYAGHAQAKGHSLERAHLIELLSEGSPSESVGTGKLDAAGKEVKEKLPAVPAYKPDVLMSAALDALENGYVSKQTQERLHAAGYSVRALGLEGAAQGQRVARAAASAVRGASGTAKRAQAGIGF